MTESKTKQYKLVASLENSLPFRVYKNPNPSLKKGFCYSYRYYDKNNQQRSISSMDLDKLKDRIIKKNLPWVELIEENGKKICKEYIMNSFVKYEL